jgi:signal transduction histidine kinase
MTCVPLDQTPRFQKVLLMDKGRRISGSVSGPDKKIPFEPGVGILSMHERAALTGGHVDIQSGTDGTSVYVMIPVDD